MRLPITYNVYHRNALSISVVNILHKCSAIKYLSFEMDTLFFIEWWLLHFLFWIPTVFRVWVHQLKRTETKHRRIKEMMNWRWTDFECGSRFFVVLIWQRFGRATGNLLVIKNSIQQCCIYLLLLCERTIFLYKSVYSSHFPNWNKDLCVVNLFITQIPLSILCWIK